MLGPAVGHALAAVGTASVGSSLVGSALGWLLGTSGSQAAVGVLAAVMVGGTAVVGTVVDTPGHSSRPAAVAVSADRAAKPLEPRAVAEAAPAKPAKALAPNKPETADVPSPPRRPIRTSP